MNDTTWFLILLFVSLLFYLIVKGAVRVVQRNRHIASRKMHLLEKARARRKVAIQQSSASGSHVRIAGTLKKAWEREKRKHRRSVILRRSTFPPA